MNKDYEMKESEDRLSKLPNSLIFLILSFVPMTEVVSTTLLSKRWNNMWKTIPYLNFSEYVNNYDDETERARNFVNRALMFWKGIKILKFSLQIGSSYNTPLASDIDLWVRFAIDNKVQELKLVACGLLDGRKAPRCLNSCSSITKLSLDGYDIEKVESPAWNQLKSLQIYGVPFYERSIDQILLGSPRLEVFELHVWDSKENMNIRSISLKKLKIHKYPEDSVERDTVLGIYCPNLETLEIKGMFLKCLVTDVPYLIDATLGFKDIYKDNDRRNELLGETLKEILPTFQHVQSLTLSAWCVEVLGALENKHLLSPLPNVKILKLHVDVIIEPVGVMNLLGIFPNLKVLVIEDHEFFDFDDHSPRNDNLTYIFGRYQPISPHKREANDFLNTLALILQGFNVGNHSNSFLLQLRTIHITTSKLAYTSKFQLIGCLLKHATMLDKLVVRANDSRKLDRDFLSKAEEILLSIPRSSPTAEVVFKAK